MNNQYQTTDVRSIVGTLLLFFTSLATGFGQCFHPATNVSVGDNPYAVATGDLNGDAKSDLVAANRFSNSVSVLLGNGDGTFQNAINYPVGNGPRSVVVGDVNGDTRLDLAVANFASHTVSILLNKGDGTFETAVSFGVAHGPCGIVLGDFNGDGKPEVATVNFTDDNLSVLKGNGDGTFGTAIHYSVGKFPFAISVGDFNGDTRPDLVTANSLINSVSILLGKGDGTFQDAVNHPVGRSPRSVVVGDFNSDAKPDLAVANSADDDVSFLPGKGDGTFDTPTTFKVSDNPYSVSSADFNGDGHPDLVTANQGEGDLFNVSVLLNQGNGSFGTATHIAVDRLPRSVVTADFNGDGRPDLATANQGAKNVSVLLARSCSPIVSNFEAVPNPVCATQSVLFSALVEDPAQTDSYSFTLTNGIDSPRMGMTTTATFSQTVTASGSDLQSYTLTVANSYGTTTTTLDLTVSALPNPTLRSNVLPSVPGLTTVLQNTPLVSLFATGCEGGTINWEGFNSNSLTLPVSTSATGTFVYSATCTQGSCSATASHTVTVSPPLVTGSFDGFVYGADCSTFRGWAWDRNKPNAPVTIDVLKGPNVLFSLPADVYRQDLQTAAKGNGKHAFFFTIPDSLKNGLSQALSARVSGSNFILKNSPKALICEGVPVPGGNKPPTAPTPTVLIAPLAAQVGVPFSGTLVAFTDSEPLTYDLSGLPGGFSIHANTRVISGTPTEAGTFVLTYSASDGQLTNSVSFPLTVNPASTTTVTGSFEGYLDKVECGTIRGWMWDRKLPNTPLTVEFYHATTQEVFGSTVANIYRDDLKNAGKGNGAHAYSFTVPNVLKDGTPRPLMARVLGSTYDLKGGPKTLSCNSPARVSAENSEGLQVTVLGNPVLDQLQVEIRGAEGQPLRLQLTDASGRLISQRYIEAAKAIEQQRFSVSHQPAGLLLLRVNSGLKRVTLKVLK